MSIWSVDFPNYFLVHVFILCMISYFSFAFAISPLSIFFGAHSVLIGLQTQEQISPRLWFATADCGQLSITASQRYLLEVISHLFACNRGDLLTNLPLFYWFNNKQTPGFTIIKETTEKDLVWLWCIRWKDWEINLQ